MRTYYQPEFLKFGAEVKSLKADTVTIKFKARDMGEAQEYAESKCDEDEYVGNIWFEAE